MRVLDGAVLDALADQIAVVDADGVIVAVNRAWREFATANGAPAEVVQSVGLNYLSACGGVADGVSSSEGAAAAAGIRAVLCEAVDTFELEYPCDSPEEARWFKMSVTPLVGHEGGPAVVVCHHNMTQRRQTEEQLRSSQDRLAITLHSIGDAVIATDAAGVITSINATAERLTGWPVAEAVGRPLPDVFGIVNEQSRLTLVKTVEMVIQRGDVVRLANHTVLQARDGREYHIADSAAPIRDRRGAIVGVVLVFNDVTEEHRSRQQLATTATLLERTNEIAHIGGWERDLVTDERVWTSGIYRILEIDPLFAATTNKTLHEYLTPDAQTQLDAAIDHAVDAGTGWDLELKLVTAKGRPIWVRAQGEFEVVGDRIVKAHGVVQDVTARKAADEALRDGAERLRAIFETEPECVKVVGADGNLSEMNTAGLRMLEADSVDDVRSHRLSEFIVPEDREAFAGLHRRVMAGENGFLEFEVIGLRGSRRRLETHATPMRDATGEVTMLLGITRDVTEQARTRRLLAEAAALMEQAGEIAKFGAVSFDLRTRTPSVSANLRTLLELDEHETPGLEDAFVAFAPLQSPETQLGVRIRLEQAIAAGTGWDFEVPLVTGTGRTIWARLRGVVEFENGVATVLRGVLQDVTERRRLEADLLQAAKTESIGRLAGGVAHDFNNMLTVILAGAEMALDELHPTEPSRVHLEQIRSAAQRSADLTGQLLAFARQQTVEPSVIDLDSTVTAMSAMLNRLIGEDVQLTWHPDPDVWPIRIDPSQFDQVLTNLVVNARDAITAAGAGNGSITISIANAVIDDHYCATHWEASPGDHVRLAITDNGVGIDEQTQRNVFEPFFTTNDHGTGLGLSTVYGIVEQNNGFITITSTPGDGAIFEVFLPRHHGAVDVDTEPPALDTDRRGHETILVVEDEPAILSMITRILEADGYFVLAASSATDALRLAHEHPGLDLLLTDVIMGDMNGRDLAAALTAAGIHTRHLFMSGYPADVITERGVLDPDLHFIQKPFSVTALTTKIRDTLVTEPHHPARN